MQSHKPSSVSFLDHINTTMELVNNFAELNQTCAGIESQHLNFQSIMGFSTENFFMQHQPPALLFPGFLAENIPGILHHDDKNVFPVAEPMRLQGNNEIHDSEKKRKAMYVPESSSGNSSPPVSDQEWTSRKNGSRKGKRMRNNEEEENPKEVVHVRARRGQATDSHSLAERVRREKINERLRCLQGIVPGCYKTMGMSVLLDEIINYVQSLQNQVEFLSMKLTAASSSYDFNVETDAMEAMQMADQACEEQKVQRLVTEGNETFASTDLFGSFDLTFGSHPSLLPYIYNT